MADDAAPHDRRTRIHGWAFGQQELALKVTPIASLGRDAAAQAFGVGVVIASLLAAMRIGLALVMPQPIRHGGDSDQAAAGGPISPS